MLLKFLMSCYNTKKEVITLKILDILTNIFSLKKTPAELVKIRNIDQSNDSSNNESMVGIVKQYKQMHDSSMANQILKESLYSLKQVKQHDYMNKKTR